ncbi:hypothetical protein CVT24_011977 [Panaeolus cyanescens]|uniref:O-methyltransferase C-terminal domain-containing protein n=1 Tax=Panaeolus cyanescens TaxID=181874 RepID=A0A409VZ26_9AGAR|nr:hypothetical protein CVT24_011977 [Panaeolus cyanescens]
MSHLHADSVTATRLEELLTTIEESAAEPKTFLAGDHNPNQPQAKSHSTPTYTSARTLYPFFGDAHISSKAAVLKLACERVNTLVTPPQLLVMQEAASFFTTAALRICVENDVATHIQELSSGDKGAPIEELSTTSMLDAKLLARTLRFLSHKGIFQEDSPGRWKNTTASLTLINDQEFKAFLSLMTNEIQNASSKLGECMEQQFTSSQMHESGTQPQQGSSELSPFAAYHGLPLYEWLHQPENISRGQNFNQAMRGLSHLESTFSLPFDYAFDSLPAGTTLVDIGGGVGAIAEILLPEYPALKMVVQDLPPVVKAAEEKPSQIIRKFMHEGRLSFRAHDFFTDQPEDLKGASFLVCNVLLNHSDESSVKILSCLRNSNPSKLLIVDRLYGPFFPTEGNTSEDEKKIYDTIRKSAKANGGVRSQSLPGVYDMIMAAMFVTKTRTLEEWNGLLGQAGFSLTSVTPLRASSGQVVIEAGILPNWIQST